MDGCLIGEKECFTIENVELGLKYEGSAESPCGKGKLTLSNMRINFTNFIGTWEEPLERLGICAISKDTAVYKQPCILCQIINPNDSNCYWVIYLEDLGRINEVFHSIINCLDKLAY